MRQRMAAFPYLVIYYLIKRRHIMGERGSKKDKAKAEKQKQSQIEKKKEQQKNKLPAKKPA